MEVKGWEGGPYIPPFTHANETPFSSYPDTPYRYTLLPKTGTRRTPKAHHRP